MTLHDPIQGILLGSPETLFCMNRPRPLRATQSRRTDRLQGIFFASAQKAQTGIASTLNDLPGMMAASARRIDDLSMDEIEEDADDILSSTRTTAATIVRNPKHRLVDTFLHKTHHLTAR